MVRPSYFEFQIVQAQKEALFTIVPKHSSGSVYFFTSLMLKDGVELIKTGVPYDNKYGYFHAYPSCSYVMIQKGRGIDKPLAVFQTQMYSNNYGLVRIGSSKHAYVFRLVKSEYFEVLVFKQMKEHSLILLQMLMDGAFDDEIEQLKLNN